MIEHDQRMRDLMETAKANLRRDGELVPVLFVEGRRNAMVAIREMAATSDGRAEILRAAGTAFSADQPTRITAVMDAYLGADVPKTGSLADDPEATECVVVSSLDARGRARMLVCSYERIPTLERLEFEFGEVREMDEGARLFLLEAFFEGVREARR